MDAIDCLKNRRAVRSYQDRPVAKEVIEDIIDCAHLAPSAHNDQPWEFIVITEQDKLNKLAELCDYGPFISEAAACIIVICKASEYYLEDGSAATENILLAARAHGIGTCWIAGDKKHYARPILEMLKVPVDYKLVSIVPLGYCKEFPEAPNKRELNAVLHWEKF